MRRASTVTDAAVFAQIRHSTYTRNLGVGSHIMPKAGSSSPLINPETCQPWSKADIKAMDSHTRNRLFTEMQGMPCRREKWPILQPGTVITKVTVAQARAQAATKRVDGDRAAPAPAATPAPAPTAHAPAAAALALAPALAAAAAALPRSESHRSCSALCSVSARSPAPPPPRRRSGLRPFGRGPSLSCRTIRLHAELDKSEKEVDATHSVG